MNETLLNALQLLGGVATSAELKARMGVSQPSVSRALSPLLRDGRVIKVGAARSQRYALPRRVEGVGNDVLIRRVDADGNVSTFGRMVPLLQGRFWVEETDGLRQLHGGLPWFLNDMKPQGFMGRAFARNHLELSLPADPRHWNDDHALKALVQAGDDLPGNLIVGELAFQRFQTLSKRQSRVSAPEQDYPELANQTLHGLVSGSSAGGEQPKFCTITNDHPVIVKFSTAGTSAVDQRGRDLLICEHLALQTLAKAHLPAAHSEIVTAGGRVFLESRRFDRTKSGRIGMVSLEVLEAEFVGHRGNWATLARLLPTKQLPSDEDRNHLRLLDAYGDLIGNTDRHYGNISFVIDGDDWRLSPTYDMLPMLYAPVNGELVERDFAARALHPNADTLGVWPQAVELASQFWALAAQDPRISKDFRNIAQTNRDTVARL